MIGLFDEEAFPNLPLVGTGSPNGGAIQRIKPKEKILLKSKFSGCFYKVPLRGI